MTTHTELREATVAICLTVGLSAMAVIQYLQGGFASPLIARFAPIVFTACAIAIAWLGSGIFRDETETADSEGETA